MSTILIADDDLLELDLLEKILTFAGYEVVQACNGSKALDVLHSRDVDMVITDINMPVMGGLELLKRIWQEGLSVPIIAISGNFDPHVAIQQGFDAFISKPFGVASLMGVVAEVLNRKTLVNS